MKTKEQILEWLGKQPWKDEFYENRDKHKVVDIRYDENFIISAFIWGSTRQGCRYWAQINKEYFNWLRDNKAIKSGKQKFLNLSRSNYERNEIEI